ncbi:unnamed protein product [Diamesa serratosioi]
MSFSKAKLKRFNEIADLASPFSKSKKEDKKAELFCDDNALPSCSEKKSKMSLFRTPSLPYRLKFRQVSDLTPSKKNSSAAKPASNVTPTQSSHQSDPIAPLPTSMFRKCERNILEKKSRDEKYIEKLRFDIELLNKQMKFLQNLNQDKNNEINELNVEIAGMKEAEEFLENLAQQSISSNNTSEERVRSILENYDILLQHMDQMSCENENLLELNSSLTQSNDEFIKINEERIHVLELEIQEKNDELLKMKNKLCERNSTIEKFEFELGKKEMDNFELTNQLRKSEEHFKIMEVQQEENLKMLKNSYESEIFFLNCQVTKAQNQLLKLNKNQKKFQNMDLETQLDYENQKTKFEIEKRNYDITIKNYQNIIEILSLRLKKSDTDVEQVMSENCDLKNEKLELISNYEQLKNSAESLKKSFDEKNILFEQLMVSSENEMITMVSKMNDYFNEKFYEVAELKKSFDIRDNNLKKMTTTILEEYTIGIELARLELDDKQKKLMDFENENKAIKYENLQLKMKLNDGTINKGPTTLSTIEEETATDDEKKDIQEKEDENSLLKLKLKVLDEKFTEFEVAAVQREKDYKQIMEQQRTDREQLKGFEKLKESNVELKTKIQKLQDNYQIFDSPTKTPSKKALFYGKENQSPIFVGHPGRAFEHSPKNILKPRN